MSKKMISLEDATKLVVKKHKGQYRKQGTPYCLHPINVAWILKDKGFDENYQIAGLFHDLIEDTDTTYEEILKLSNEEIANAVKLVTKEKGYDMKEYIERISKNDMARMVKLADRLHNILETKLADMDFQKKYVKETEDWYLDLAKDTCFEEELTKEIKSLKKGIAKANKKLDKKLEDKEK